MEELDLTGSNFINKDYPKVYSPVIVTRDQESSVGSTLIYPYLDYKNSVRVILRKEESGELAGTWSHRYDARDNIELLPEEVRTYTISVRFAPERYWLLTTYPYKEFFQEYYGSFNNSREPDRRPIFKRSVSSMNTPYTEANPRAYNLNLNIHDLGWGPFVTSQISSLEDNGFSRSVIWKPSGRYKGTVCEFLPEGTFEGCNFPPQFMDFLPHLEASDGNFTRYADNGIELGFWWGRASQYPQPLYPYWNHTHFPDTLWDARIDNITHTDFLSGQLQQAVNRGAKLVGLDGFNRMPAWERYEWVEQMKDQAPGVLFVHEGSGSDFLHSRIGNWYFPCRWGRYSQLGPDELSNYLGNKNSEVWVSFRQKTEVNDGSACDPDFYVSPTTEQLQEIISWGFTPMIKDNDVNITGGFNFALVECFDGIDNDPQNDDGIDFPYDLDCESASDNSES